MDIKEKLKNDGDKALEFVSEKYQKEFHPKTYEMADYLSDTDRMHCYTEGMDIENEHVEVYITEEDGRVAYYDNYFSFYIRPYAEEYIGEMISKEFEEFKVYRDNEYGALPNELTCESTLDDLYRVKSDYWMSVKVYIKGNPEVTEEEYGKKMANIEKLLLDSGHRYTISIFVVSDAVYQSLERYSQDTFFRFYAEHRNPDGETYYYVYKHTIIDGKVR